MIVLGISGTPGTADRPLERESHGLPWPFIDGQATIGRLQISGRGAGESGREVGNGSHFEYVLF
jgi:hypothetical protein